MTTLDLLISTLDDGILGVPAMLLPKQERLRYVVTWQRSGACTATDVPATLSERDDVTVKTLQGKGLSRSRNECIAAATSTVCVIADDDCRYTASALLRVLDTFDSDPTLQLATFEFASNEAQKIYPHCEFDLRHPPKGYYVSSIELAFRREAVQGKLAFDTRFGLGSGRFLCGEEELFVHQALKHGLRCRHFPFVVATHPHATTGDTRATEPGVLRARGKILAITKPMTCLPRAALMAWRVSHQWNVPLAKTLAEILKGVFGAGQGQ